MTVKYRWQLFLSQPTSEVPAHAAQSSGGISNSYIYTEEKSLYILCVCNLFQFLVICSDANTCQIVVFVAQSYQRPLEFSLRSAAFISTQTIVTYNIHIVLFCMLH